MPKIGQKVALFLLLSFNSVSSLTWESTCTRIKSSISNETSVDYPNTALLGGQYSEDISHWASSSSHASACSVRPGTTEDLSKIVQILGSTKTPFAVKGGGHATNPGFSSTPGVLIAMSRFSEVTYDATSQTAVVGSGLIWDDVYEALEPHKVTVVGGRSTGVGVGGFSLGGGYSYLTNQHGLTIDNIVAYELVRPDGVVAQVTEASDPDIFFGLKGGLNNFGIVTKFTMRVFSMDKVWGGPLWYTEFHLKEVSKAIATFSAENQDPKASLFAIYHPIDDIIPLWSSIYGAASKVLFGQPAQGGVAVFMFYDGPQPPTEVFDSFMRIPHLYEDVKPRNYLSLVQSFPTNFTYGLRATFETVPIRNITPRILDVIHNETQFWGSRLSGQAGSFYFIEPFLSTHLSQSPLITPTAWPPTRSTAYTPALLAYFWINPSLDDTVYEAVRLSAGQIRRALIEEGQVDPDNAPKYPNYAMHGTSLENLYGENLARLRELKKRVDPENVMGLAGGWKF